LLDRAHKIGGRGNPKARAAGHRENAGLFDDRWRGLSVNDRIITTLEKRLGPLHAKQRLGIERDHEAQIFGHGINFFHIENWYSIHSVIRNTLRLLGLYRRGQKNAGGPIQRVTAVEGTDVAVTQTGNGRVRLCWLVNSFLSSIPGDEG
jgi:hypothetical protein